LLKAVNSPDTPTTGRGIELAPMTSHPSAIPASVDLTTAAGKQAARRRRWFIASIVVIAPLALVIMGGLAAWIWRLASIAAAMHDVQEEVARIQAAGEPITTEDTKAYLRVPPGTQDTTPLWQAAIDSFDQRSFRADAKDLPIVDSRDDLVIEANELAAVEQFLAKYDATVQATLVAAGAPGESRFFVDFEEGFFSPLPHMDGLSPIAKLMTLRGRTAISRSDVDRALQSVEAQFAISNALSRQLTLVEHLSRLKIASRAISEATFVMNEVPLTEEQLSRLQADVQSLDLQQSLTKGALGDRASGYFAFHHPEQVASMESMNMEGGMMMMDEVPDPPSPNDGRLTKPIDCRLYLDLQRQVITATSAPFPAALDQLNQVMTRFRSLRKSPNPLEKFDSHVTVMIFSAYEHAFLDTARHLAMRNVVLCALASERHRLKHGNVPKNLGELVPEFLPEIPNDPFDGQPVRMAVSEAELVIYSVGKDRNDDNGQDPEGKGEPDVAVRLRIKP